MFRHEEKFCHPPGLAVRVGDGDDLEEKVEAIKALEAEHMGQELRVETIALHCESGDAGTLADAAEKLAEDPGYPIVLVADEASQLEDAARAVADDRPLLWERGGPSDDLVELAAELELPLVVEGTLEECDEKAQEVADAGVEDIVLSPGDTDPADALEFLTIARRAALRKSHRPMGYPVLVQTQAEEPEQETLEAMHYVLKYAGIVVTDIHSPEYMLPVLTARQSIYIDPQVPVQVEPGVHEVNEPGDEAPLLVTTNFSLTYYSVLSEVEASHVPARIVTVDTEGTSVLTAWAAGDFGGTQVAEALKDSGAFEALKEEYRKPVIPGLVAVISGELEEEAGHEVIVGPREASELPAFLNNQWPELVE
jgi:acetyl-CoA decarbonylase/synthase complex subunit gamma